MEKYHDMLNKKVSIYWKPYLILFAIMLLAMLSIIRVNYNYEDDIERLNYGIKGWDHFSRYLSCFFSGLIHTTDQLTDVSPLTQIIAVAILALSGIIVIKGVVPEKTITFLLLLAVLPLGINPYFLSCLSYKFDAPYMAFSILSSVFPVIFINKNAKVFFAMSALSSIGVCLTYQAAVGIYPMLILLLFYMDWNQGGKFFYKKVLIAAAGYLLGLLVFFFLLMKPIAEDDYVSSGIAPLTQLLPCMLKHYRSYLKLIRNDFNSVWKVFSSLVVIGFLLVMVLDSRRNKILSLFMGILTVVVMGALIFGVYPAMEKGFSPPRAMYGVGVFLAFLSLVLVTRSGGILWKAAVVGLSWCFFVFAFSYGNALGIQDEYSDFLMESVIDDLDDLGVFNEYEKVYMNVAGGSGRAPLIEVMDHEYPVLRRLVRPAFDTREGYWAFYTLRYSYPFHYRLIPKEMEDMELPVIREAIFYTICGKDDHIRIILK